MLEVFTALIMHADFSAQGLIKSTVEEGKAGVENGQALTTETTGERI